MFISFCPKTVEGLKPSQTYLHQFKPLLKPSIYYHGTYLHSVVLPHLEWGIYHPPGQFYIL